MSHSFASLTREILFLPLEHKIHIFSPSCNILYICAMEIQKIHMVVRFSGFALFTESECIAELNPSAGC